MGMGRPLRGGEPDSDSNEGIRVSVVTDTRTNIEKLLEGTLLSS